MERKQNKIYIEYICPRCKKNFGNLKYHYNNHINKKNPCILLLNKNDDIITNVIETDYNNINIENIKNKKDIILNICGDLKTNNNITEESNNDIMMINLMEKIDLLIKQNEEHKIEIIKLKEENKEDIKKIKDELKQDIKILHIFTFQTPFLHSSKPYKNYFF